VAVRAPPDKRERRPDQPALRGTLTAPETLKVSDMVPDPANGDALVVDLAEWRARRRAREHLAQAGLLPNAPVPCGPCCRCFGQPMGAGCGP
jgi:hypothetical protein